MFVTIFLIHLLEGHCPMRRKFLILPIYKKKLNLKKCKEMQLDFRINKTEIPSLTVDNVTMEKVFTFKLLDVWIDDNLKWQTNTDRIIKQLFMLKTLKKHGASETDLKRFYTSVIRSVLEYGAQVWHSTGNKQ